MLRNKKVIPSVFDVINWNRTFGWLKTNWQLRFFVLSKMKTRQKQKPNNFLFQGEITENLRKISRL